MVTMEEQDNYDTTPTTLLIPSSPSERFFFLDEVAFSKLNLHGGIFRK